MLGVGPIGQIALGQLPTGGLTVPLEIGLYVIVPWESRTIEVSPPIST